MTTKHTPGPWEVRKYGSGGIDVIDRNASTVAAIHLDDGDSDIYEADAHLIAAAPTMLAALEIALELLGNVTAMTDSEADYLGQAENTISLAIAKAKGDT